MKAFRCSRTGVLFPSDYYEKWGSRYGIGMGRIPVSEAVCTDYSSIPVECKSDPNLTMHSTYACRAPVILCDVTEEEFVRNEAIIRSEDPKGRRTSELMRAKQLVKSLRMKQIHGESAVTEATKYLAAKEKEVAKKVAALKAA